MKRLILAGVAALVSGFTALPAHALCAAPKDINGTWYSDDGGTYYVRQVDGIIWWVGMSSDKGQTWTNVFRGQRKLDKVFGTWSDVPRNPNGKASSGELNLALSISGTSVGGWKMTTMTGGFSGKNWFKRCGDNQALPAN